MLESVNILIELLDYSLESISHLQSGRDRRHLDVLVDVELEVFTGQDYTAVVHESHVVALRVLHLGLQGRDEETFLGVNRQVEVVVVISHGDL